ncbi:MAG: hypothetical protein ACOYM3_20700, partial [Terrimicrobiaceae bacterium]
RMKSIRNLVQAQAFFHATTDHEEKYANGAMNRITMPSALLSCLLLFPLRGQESRQKQVVAGHRGR